MGILGWGVWSLRLGGPGVGSRGSLRLGGPGVGSLESQVRGPWGGESAWGLSG